MCYKSRIAFCHNARILTVLPYVDFYTTKNSKNPIFILISDPDADSYPSRHSLYRLIRHPSSSSASYFSHSSNPLSSSATRFLTNSKRIYVFSIGAGGDYFSTLYSLEKRAPSRSAGRTPRIILNKFLQKPIRPATQYLTNFQSNLATRTVETHSHKHDRLRHCVVNQPLTEH